MVYLGLILSDVFETDKGCFIVDGIAFKNGKRIGVNILPYRVKDERNQNKSFLSDDDLKKNYSKIKYLRNES